MVPIGVQTLPHAERRLTSQGCDRMRRRSKPETEAQSIMSRLERQASSGLATGTVPALGYRPGNAGLSPASSRPARGVGQA